MMVVARRSGDDGRVTVANSYKQLHQPGALGNECTTVISKPPHTPCSSFSLALFLNALRRHPPPRAHLQLPWYITVSSTCGSHLHDSHRPYAWWTYS